MKKMYRFMEVLAIILLAGTLGGVDTGRISLLSGVLIILACIGCLAYGTFGEVMEINREKNKIHKDKNH